MSREKPTANAPRLAGNSLKVVAGVVDTRLLGDIILSTMLEQAGVNWLRDMFPKAPLPVKSQIMLGKNDQGGLSARPGAEQLCSKVSSTISGKSSKKPKFSMISDIVSAYRNGITGPVDLAQRLIENLKKADSMEPVLGAVTSWKETDILAQASASAERLKAGRPRSVLDGVPLVVKEELDVAGFPTTVGTSFLGKEPALEDAVTVARLRRAGAVILGKSNMHEIGMGVTGLNPHHKSARNPYDVSRATGGSSSGSASAVASGLCPVAIGADGGGSIRIPSALCGVVGLKPTFGRVSEKGAAPLCWSVAHIGPLAWNTIDAACVYAAIAGPDPGDPNSMEQPAPSLSRLLSGIGISRVRLGLCSSWLDRSSNDVRMRCEETIQALANQGADIVQIDEPVDLDLVLTTHLVTIVSEMAAAHAQYYNEHKADYSPETRLNLALARRLTAVDYIQAQRHRVEISRAVMSLFDEIDALLMPSTAITAPRLARDSLKTGESNLDVTKEIMKFSPLANLTGLPAISFPAGYDVNSMPIGLQAIGKPWSEDLLLTIAMEAEKVQKRRLPGVRFNLL
ncbi:MAG: amidase [Deltaproteobacteria bacterium]|nr:amidase [Deltaproteobacteria bacterium]